MQGDRQRDPRPPHMREDRHEWHECPVPDCETRTKADFCEAHRQNSAAKLQVAAERMGEDLVSSPGGFTLHLPGCDVLPDEEHRWRPPPTEDPASNKTNGGGCQQCLRRAIREDVI